MDGIYTNFYRNFYRRTDGFIPAKPLNLNLYPGDFFQIKNGEIIILGNIYRNNIIQDIELTTAIHLNPSGWSFSDGVTKPYSGRSNGYGAIEGQFEYSKQILSFADKGSFLFKAESPESVKINNWNEIQQQLIIKLTQTIYSFRELYLVTESATTANSTLVIASNTGAELEIASDTENFGLVDIFGHHTAKTIQSREIEYYHREEKRKPSFFKAKKLIVQDEKLEVFISDLITKAMNTSEWANNFFEYEFHHDAIYYPPIKQNTQASLLDMLQANELNPNTALLYFKWSDANLDDVEKLFQSYGN